MDALDWDALRENCAGDEGLVNEVLDLFRKEADALLADIENAVRMHDAVAIKRSAHRLKGALVSLGARPSVDAARALELAGSSNQLEGVQGMYQTLATEMGRLLGAIALPHAA